MPISMYSASAPIFTKLLGALKDVVAKGEAHEAATGAAPGSLLDARLYPDMFPLSWQVMASANFAQSCIARLAGVAVPTFDSKATGWDEARARIDTALTFIASIAPAQIDGSEDRAISYFIGETERRYQGEPYLLHAVMPQFVFHVTTAYAILRHNGVVLGKKDFLGT